MIPLIETLEINLWLQFLINATMKSLVIFAVAGLFVFILRRHSAAVRALIWGLAILGCLGVPLFSFALPQWEVGVLPATREGFEADRSADHRQPARPSVPTTSDSLPSTIASSTQTTPIPLQPKTPTSESNAPQLYTSGTGFASLHWTDWLAMCWVGGALFLLARLIVGIGAVWHVSTRSNNFKGLIPYMPPNWKRPVSVRQSDAVTVPMVWGVFRPVILLPADAEDWQPERQRAVLLHELAHIQRQDWLMQTMAQITCAVYWFNPLVWFAARWRRIEVEGACDDHVLNAGYQSTDYAQHLLDIVRNIKATGIAKRSAVAMARSSKIEGRIQTVLAENRNRCPMTKIAVAIGLLAFTCFAVPMGVMRLAETVKQGTTQLYQPYTSSLRTTPTSRLDSFTYTLTTLQQFGGGEVIFEGGTGFVRFRVRKDGSLVAMIPVFAKILHISSNTPLARMSLHKQYYTIRLTSWDREQLGQMAVFQNAEERAIPYPKTDPHIFLEADVGSDISAAAELTEAVLAKVFQVKKGMITTFGGDYREFRSSAPLGR